MNEQMNEILINIEDKMKKVFDTMLKDFSYVRTDLANPNILDKINIIYYGVRTPIKQLCTINIVEGTKLNIKPYENSIVKDVYKAILSSDLGITPQLEGDRIILIFPRLTEERRKQLIKEIENISEKNKIFVRNIRREGNDKIKKNELTKDLKTHFLEQIQIITDKYIKFIEEKTLMKNKELLKI